VSTETLREEEIEKGVRKIFKEIMIENLPIQGKI
jgi:hypothetical protein